MPDFKFTTNAKKMDEAQLIGIFHLFYGNHTRPTILIKQSDRSIVAINKAGLYYFENVTDKEIPLPATTLFPDINDKVKTSSGHYILHCHINKNTTERRNCEITHIEGNESDYLILCIGDPSEWISFKEDLIRFSPLLDSVGEGLIITDFNGTIQYSNKTAQLILKHPLQELTNASIYSVFYTFDKKKRIIKESDCELVKAIKKHTKTRKEDKIYRGDGEIIDIEYIVNPLIENNKPVNAVLTFKNISQQKEFEESLLENEARFRSMFQNSFDTITIMDKNGHVKFTSSKDGNVFEYVFNDVLGKDMINRVKLEKIKNTELAFEFAFWDALANPHKSIRVEHSSRRQKDGEYVYVESIISNHLNNPAINGIVVNSREITERVIAERTLTKQHNLLKAIINSTPDLIYIKDTNGIYLECNFAFCDFAGCSEKEIIGKTDFDLFEPPIAATLKSLDDRTLKNKSFNNNEIWMTYPDGKKVLFDTITAPYLSKSEDIFGIVGISRDITERKQNEQLLRENEARLKEVQTISQIGSFEYDLITQKAVFSDNYLTILGINDESIISSFKLENLIKHVYPEDQQIVLDSFQGALFEFKRYKFTYRVKTSEGKIKHIYTIGNYNYDHKGNPVKLISTIQDITQQKLNEELQRNIELVNRTAEIKQQFLANMSHEMRTPMTGILGMIDFLLTTNLDEQQLDYSLTIKKSANSLLNIINDVLLLSKIEAGKLRLFPRTFDIYETLNDVQSLFSALVKHKKIEFKNSILPDVPKKIIADENRLKQIITNLLSNAVKFTDHGSIEIHLSAKKIEKSNIEFLVEVSDTGIGIDEHEKEVLFSKFSQADSTLSRNYEGIGLGLTISKELIHLMEGEIGIESLKGEGSKFWFTFKATIADQKSDQNNEKKQASMDEYKFNIHVLIVEDKFVNSKVIAMMLESIGATTDIASNGFEALDKYEPGKFHLIFMDIQMPSMDGVATTQNLRETHSELPPIIGLSANAMEGDAEKYIEKGMDDYLSKPVTLDVIQQKLIQWIDPKYIEGIKDKKEKTKKQSVTNQTLCVNKETIDLIYQQAKGDTSILHELFNSFINDVKTLISDVQKDIEHGDYKKIQESIHTIKGLSATIGATQLHEISTQIDQYYKQGHFEKGNTLIPELKNKYEVVKEYIEKNHL